MERGVLPFSAAVHSASAVTLLPSALEDTWREEVREMRRVYSPGDRLQHGHYQQLPERVLASSVALHASAEYKRTLHPQFSPASSSPQQQYHPSTLYSYRRALNGSSLCQHRSLQRLKRQPAFADLSVNRLAVPAFERAPSEVVSHDSICSLLSKYSALPRTWSPPAHVLGRGRFGVVAVSTPPLSPSSRYSSSSEESTANQPSSGLHQPLPSGRLQGPLFDDIATFDTIYNPQYHQRDDISHELQASDDQNPEVAPAYQQPNFEVHDSPLQYGEIFDVYQQDEDVQTRGFSDRQLHTPPLSSYFTQPVATTKKDAPSPLFEPAAKRVRHFKSSKRLPKYAGTTLHQPPTPVNTHPPTLPPSLRDSNDNVVPFVRVPPRLHRSSSAFPLSHYAAALFPPSPPPSAGVESRMIAPSAHALAFQHLESSPQLGTPATLHFADASFDMVNPRDSLRLRNIVTPAERDRESYFSNEDPPRHVSIDSFDDIDLASPFAPAPLRLHHHHQDESPPKGSYEATPVQNSAVFDSKSRGFRHQRSLATIARSDTFSTGSPRRRSSSIPAKLRKVNNSTPSRVTTPKQKQTHDTALQLQTQNLFGIPAGSFNADHDAQHTLNERTSPLRRIASRLNPLNVVRAVRRGSRLENQTSHASIRSNAAFN